MVARGHFLAATDAVDPEDGPAGPFLPVAVPPAMEPAFEQLRGRWVEATGYFGDPAAETCTVVASDPALGAVPTPEEAVALCQTSFVLKTVEPVATPATDTSAGSEPDSQVTSIGMVLALVFWLWLTIATHALVARGRPQVGPAEPGDSHGRVAAHRQREDT